MEVKCTDVKVFKSFVYWANSRITEEESNVKNKENGTDGALYALTWVHRAHSRIIEVESNVKNKENDTDGALSSHKPASTSSRTCSLVHSQVLL